MRRTFFVALAVLLSYSSLSHAALGFGRTYTQMQTAPDAFVIIIKGRVSNLDKVISGLMTRASEVTIANGYHYFVITSEMDEPLGKSGFFVNQMPGRSIMIKCFKEEPKDMQFTDAHFFLKGKTKKR
jgi:hypothetical protein